MNFPAQHFKGRFRVSSQRLLIMAIAGVIGSLACWLALRTPVPLREVTRDHLELRDGVLYEKGGTRPFEGLLVERYPDGRLLSRSRVGAGRLQGLSEGWYPDGQLQVQEEYRQGIIHGRRIKWYPDGTTQSVAHLVDGQYHGPYQRWHENGALAEEVMFESGQPHGWARSYDPDGSPKAEIRLEHGRVVERRLWPAKEASGMAGTILHPASGP